MRAPRAASCSRRSRTRTPAFNWNAATDSYEDLLDTGVIDPATVTMQAILNSCSIASSVLTTSVLITEIKEEEEEGMADMGQQYM